MPTGVSVTNPSPSTDRARETNEGNLPGNGDLVSFVVFLKTTGPVRKGETWVEVHIVDGRAEIGNIKAGVLEGYVYGGKNPKMKVPPIPLGKRDRLMLFSYNSSTVVKEIKGAGRVVP